MPHERSTKTAGGTAVAECAAEEGAVSSHATFAVLAAACAFGSLGCEATFTPAEPIFSVSGGGMVVRATAVPPDVWSYPRVYYDGGYVYLVNGLWYEPTPQGWVVYRREPVELARQRVRLYAVPRGDVLPRTPAYSYPPYRGQPRQSPEEYGRERAPLPR
jgi:hypothetical protein